MLSTQVLPDELLKSGMVKAQPCAFQPGLAFRVKANGRAVHYVGPHMDRHGTWTGKVRVIYLDTKREAVVRPAQIEEARSA